MPRTLPDRTALAEGDRSRYFPGRFCRDPAHGRLRCDVHTSSLAVLAGIYGLLGGNNIYNRRFRWAPFYVLSKSFYLSRLHVSIAHGSVGTGPAMRSHRERVFQSLGTINKSTGMAHLARESIPITPPHVLIQADGRALDPITVTAPRTAWRLLGQFGVLLAVMGWIDIALHWYPPAFRSPEWELGTVATTFAALPLPTMGLMAALGSAMARAARRNLVVLSVVQVLIVLFLAASLIAFLLDVPLALRAVAAPGVPGPAAIEMKRTIVRALVMGIGFGAVYLYGTIVSTRFLLRRVKDA